MISTTLQLDDGVANMASLALAQGNWEDAENLLMVLHVRKARGVRIGAFTYAGGGVRTPDRSKRLLIDELVAEVTAPRSQRLAPLVRYAEDEAAADTERSCAPA